MNARLSSEKEGAHLSMLQQQPEKEGVATATCVGHMLQVAWLTTAHCVGFCECAGSLHHG